MNWFSGRKRLWSRLRVTYNNIIHPFSTNKINSIQNSIEFTIRRNRMILESTTNPATHWRLQVRQED